MLHFPNGKTFFLKMIRVISKVNSVVFVRSTYFLPMFKYKKFQALNQRKQPVSFDLTRTVGKNGYKLIPRGFQLYTYYINDLMFYTSINKTKSLAIETSVQ